MTPYVVRNVNFFLSLQEFPGVQVQHMKGTVENKGLQTLLSDIWENFSLSAKKSSLSIVAQASGLLLAPKVGQLKNLFMSSRRIRHSYAASLAGGGC